MVGALLGNQGATQAATGATWTARTVPEGQWRDITYAAGTFVAVGSSGAKLIYSSDFGNTWTAYSGEMCDFLQRITYGAGKFLAIGGQNDQSACYMLSSDGSTWARTVATDLWGTSGPSTAFGGSGTGTFVAKPWQGIYVWKSPDGSTWQAQDINSSGYDVWNGGVNDLAWGAGTFVAVGGYPPYPEANPRPWATVAISTDNGLTWTDLIPTESTGMLSWESVVFGNGRFVAVGKPMNGSSAVQVMTSANGSTWASATSVPLADGWTAVTYGNGYFVAIASWGKIMSSTDGVTWVLESVPEAFHQLIAAGGGRFVTFTSSTSVLVGAVRASQTVEFSSTAPANAVKGVGSYTPIAAATSGLTPSITVDASSTSVCSLNAGVVSFDNAGTCTLNADQPGNSDYSPAAQAQQSFTIAPGGPDPVAMRYSGDTYLLLSSSSAYATLSLSAQLSSAGSCMTEAEVSFKQDANGDGVYETSLGSATTNALGVASLAWSGRTAGIYEVEATSVGSTRCQSATTTATLVVATLGDAASGGAGYSVPSMGRAAFGFTAQVKSVNKTLVASGQLLWQNALGTRFRGAVTVFAKVCPSGVSAPVGAQCGYLTGTGSLFRWNEDARKWDLASAGVRYELVIIDGGTNTNKNGGGTLRSDYFRISFALPNVPGATTNLTQVNGGNIVVK